MILLTEVLPVTIFSLPFIIMARRRNWKLRRLLVVLALIGLSWTMFVIIVYVGVPIRVAILLLAFMGVLSAMYGYVLTRIDTWVQARRERKSR